MRKTVFLLTILIFNQRWRNHWWLLTHGLAAFVSSRNKEAAEKPQYLTVCHRKTGYATDHAGMAALVVTWPRAVPAPSHCRSTPARRDATSRCRSGICASHGHPATRLQTTRHSKTIPRKKCRFELLFLVWRRQSYNQELQTPRTNNVSPM